MTKQPIEVVSQSTKFSTWMVGTNPLRYESIHGIHDLEKIITKYEEDGTIPEEIDEIIGSLFKRYDKVKGIKERKRLSKIILTFISEYEKQTENIKAFNKLF